MPESPDGPVFDVDQAEFDARVVQRSRELPVVVDSWAAWCGPCKALTPALEAAARGRAGKVELAKVDVDRNQALAARFGIRGIPAVKAFRDGKVAAEFVGALPPPKVEEFFDSLVPSEADELATRGLEEGDEKALRAALELDPRSREARRALGRLLLERGEPADALAVLDGQAGDFVADGLAARARLALAGERELADAFDAWDRGDHEAALRAMEEALEASDDPDRRDGIRRLMVAIFTELGADHPVAREHRRRLAAALS